MPPLVPTTKISLDVARASDADLLKFYNEHSGSRNPIKKFTDRESAEQRVNELIAAHNDLASGNSKESKPAKAGKGAKAPKAAKEKPAKAPKAPKQPKEKGEGGQGRSSGAAGKKIYKVGEHKKTNPRREGTHGYKSWEAIKDGMTYEAFIEAGGRNRDLMHDVNQGRLELK